MRHEMDRVQFAAPVAELDEALGAVGDEVLVQARAAWRGRGSSMPKPVNALAERACVLLQVALEGRA
jgi:hypothetical protein